MIRFKFILIMPRIRFENPGSFSKISERFRNIQISTNSEGDIELVVEKKGTRSLALLIKEATTEANDLADRLSILPNHRIISLIYKGYYNDSGNFNPDQVKPGNKFTLSGVIKYPEEFYSQDSVKATINSKKNSGIIRIYRIALGIPDKISQYLIFYGLLLILKGEKQSEVDKYIKNEIPDILIVSGKRGDETIITNIRNMIAHPPKDLDMVNLNNNLNDYISDLEGLVLNLLSEK